MAKKSNRKFYKYTLQMHGPSGKYDDLFETLRSVKREERLFSSSSSALFIEEVSRIEGGIMVRILGIQKDTDYTTFDVRDFSTSGNSLPENKRFAVAAHGMHITGSRRFVFEYVRGGPKFEDALEAIQNVVSENSDKFQRLRLVATPVVGETFIKDVNRFDRIRTVRIDIAEPNANWTDWDDPLHELGDESGADHVSLLATAPRAESLKKNKGIVQILKQALKSPNSHLERAVVEGKMPNETGPRTVRTDKHHEFETRQVSVDSGGSTNVVSARVALEAIARPDVDPGV